MLKAVTLGAVHTRAHTHTSKFIKHILNIANKIKNRDLNYMHRLFCLCI